jgi:hypothetical protein
MVRDESGPPCPRCSKPVRHNTLVLYWHGHLVHPACRTRELELEAVEQIHRADVAQSRAAGLFDERLQKPARARSEKQEGCPVCRESATVTDWRPALNWFAIEHCSCRGFFIWGPLMVRMPGLTDEDRQTLSQRIRELRARNTEAWISTRDGTPLGPSLVVRDERPDRPP